MNNLSNDNINGKILFGIDYLNLMRSMEIPREGEKFNDRKTDVIDSVIRLFLLQWDFLVEEIDDVNSVFWDKFHNGTLEQDINVVIDRIVNFLKDNRESQEKLIIQMTAVAQMDEYILEDEKGLPLYLVQRFDFRRSEFEKLFKIGWSWSQALHHLGARFIEYQEKTNK